MYKSKSRKNGVKHRIKKTIKHVHKYIVKRLKSKRHMNKLRHHIYYY